MSTFYDQHYTMYLARLRCSTCTPAGITASEMHDARMKRDMTDAWAEAAQQSRILRAARLALKEEVNCNRVQSKRLAKLSPPFFYHVPSI